MFILLLEGNKTLTTESLSKIVLVSNLKYLLYQITNMPVTQIYWQCSQVVILKWVITAYLLYLSVHYL